MPTPTIAVLEGDGVGPEIIAEALKTLKVVQSAFDLTWEAAVFPCGGKYWLAHKEEWPSDAREFCSEQADAILFGSVGLPGVDLPTGGPAGIGVVFFLRQGLDLYASLRPVELLAPIPGVPYRPDQVKLHLVREVTEGLYSKLGGISGRDRKSGLAIDVRVITSKATERVAKFAFQLAQRLREGGDSRSAPSPVTCPVTCIDKSNVLSGCQLFRQTVQEVAEKFPGLKLGFAYVDNFALEVLRRPETYSVCVTSNAFGDILSDLLAYLEGGNGMAATGNFGDHKAMFEPLHGPQPVHQGKGTVNPVAIHRCLAMMLSWLGERYANPTFTRASVALVSAIRQVLTTGEVRTPDLQGRSSTTEMSDAFRRAFLEFAKHGEPAA